MVWLNPASPEHFATSGVVSLVMVVPVVGGIRYQESNMRYV
jgi:hypothetical protein